MARSLSLVGTRRGYQRCGGCGHARIRHPRSGTLGCAGIEYDTYTGCSGRPIVMPRRCECRGFTEPEEIETCRSTA